MSDTHYADDDTIALILSLEQQLADVTKERDAAVTQADVMRKDFAPLQQFHSKHALGSMLAPSCLVCGNQTHAYTRPAVIQHLELPGIVVCESCRVSSQELTAAQAERDELRALNSALEVARGFLAEEVTELKAQVVAQQARIRDFRVLVNRAGADYRTVYSDSSPLYCSLIGDYEACDDALGIPDDTQALAAHDARLREEFGKEAARYREELQTIRLATCDYTVGTRASLEAAHKLATAALKEKPE